MVSGKSVVLYSKLIEYTERALEIPIVTEVKGDDGMVPVRPAANDAYKVCDTASRER